MIILTVCQPDAYSINSIQILSNAKHFEVRSTRRFFFYFELFSISSMQRSISGLVKVLESLN